MTFDLKPISKEGVPAALEKAQRYRLLNEPAAAESIYLDVLAVDPQNQQALVALALSITDQFRDELSAGVRRAREVLSHVRDEYKRNYYGGIVCERYAMAQLRHGAPRAAESAYEWLREAMEWYEKAEAIRPPGNDESILRWNTCARILARNPSLAPAPADVYEPSFD
jgi:hypothetical protein